jgi:GAF domain-containing protein
VVVCVLEQLHQRLKAQVTFRAAVETILADTVALHGAEFGNVQLAVGDKLVIVAAHGLRAPFLLAFREVRITDGCACGRAWQTGEQIIIADVNLDGPFAPFTEIAKEAGYRSVQSTPLIAQDGTRLGMVSTQFKNPYVPTGIEMAVCKTYCTRAADHLQALLDGSSLKAEAQRMHDTLYADVGAAAGTPPPVGGGDETLPSLGTGASGL